MKASFILHNSSFILALSIPLPGAIEQFKSSKFAGREGWFTPPKIRHHPSADPTIQSSILFKLSVNES